MNHYLTEIFPLLLQLSLHVLHTISPPHLYQGSTVFPLLMRHNTLVRLNPCEARCEGIRTTFQVYSCSPLSIQGCSLFLKSRVFRLLPKCSLPLCRGRKS